MNDTIDKAKIRERIAELKVQVKGVWEQRRFYGETGFRVSRLTDGLKTEAEKLERQVQELEKLLGD